MTLRTLPRSRLDRVLPPLVRDHTLVALVPITDDQSWAAEATWEVARSAGRDGRIVTLGDLCFEAPLLHRIGGLEPSPGLVDAFAADAPLSDIVREVRGVHFLPAGMGASDGASLRGAARWTRLQAGFKSQGALLLLYVPAERLNELGVPPDGVLALAPAGVDLGSPPGRALLAARARGSALLGVVRERWTAPAAAAPLVSGTRPPRSRPILVMAVAAAAIGSVALLATAKESFLAHDATPWRSLPTLVVADSGAWTLQLAAYGTPGRALAHATELNAAGYPTFVTPVALDASGALWYRVQVGAFATRDAAVAARDTCQRRGLAAVGEGEILRAPYSLSLTRPADVTRLRAAGYAVVRWGDQGRLLVGAFENQDQAAIALTELSRTGISATLISRTGPTP